MKDFRIQDVLYPDNSPEINSVDTLRKGLSMILQHIYVPVEDKAISGDSQMRTPARSCSQRKRDLNPIFLSGFSELKQYFFNEFVEEQDYRFVNKLNRLFFAES